jgi:uncharacterized protein (TIGR00159 family)
MSALLAHLAAGLTLRGVITTVIDVAIVYYIIYRALLLIRGTRAAQMLIGLILIGAGFFLAKKFELMTVSWLLDNFVSYGILIVIVVFQADIRRGLVRIGRNLFSPSRTLEGHVLDEVAAACAQMARGHIGALLVLERDAEVSEFIEHGVEIDARVSRELLASLFVPSRDNLMHDGAVLIRNLRVSRAGCVLPLSKSANLDAQLGTRHRAALGLTEETDAVVIVVSEERGTIAVCSQGAWTPDLPPEGLRAALAELFERRETTPAAPATGAASGS